MRKSTKWLTFPRSVMNEDLLDLAASLKNSAIHLYSEGHYQGALSLLNQALSVLADKNGSKHPQIAEVLFCIGLINKELGRYQESAHFMDQARLIYEVSGHESITELVRCLNELGNIYALLDDLNLARSHLLQALEVCLSNFGGNHIETASTYARLGEFLHGVQDHSSALHYFKLATLAFHSLLEHNEGISKANILDHLAVLYAQDGDHDSSIGYAQSSLSIYQHELGEVHPKTALALSNLASLLNFAGEYESAKVNFERSLKIRIQVFGLDHLETAKNLRSLGYSYQGLGHYQSAQSAFQKTTEIFRRLFDDNHPYTAQSLYDLGLCQADMGDYDQAKKNLNEALKMFEGLFGKNHRQNAPILRHLSHICATESDYVSASHYRKRAHNIAQLSSGLTDSKAVDDLTTLADLSEEIGDYGTAEEYLDQALRVSSTALGFGHLETANILMELGHLHSQVKDYGTAALYCKRAVDIFQLHLGTKHPQTAISLYFLCRNLALSGEKEEFQKHVLEITDEIVSIDQKDDLVGRLIQQRLADITPAKLSEDPRSGTRVLQPS